MSPDIYEQAIAAGACRALTKRAAVLRERAGKLVSSTTDSRGRSVAVVEPEATVMLGTAALFEECAAEIADAHGKRRPLRWPELPQPEPVEPRPPRKPLTPAEQVPA